jgi:hypothetical protein
MAERSGEGLALQTASHLGRCSECAERYRALSVLLDEDRSGADADVEATFSADVLQHQRQQIIARLEHAGQAARVLSFPMRAVRRATRPSDRALPRWTAAAAAGIFLGMGLHIVYENSQMQPRTEAASAVNVPPPTPVPALEQAAPAMDPDTFFSTLDAALGGPRDPELMSIDALTPRAQEISMQVR